MYASTRRISVTIEQEEGCIKEQEESAFSIILHFNALVYCYCVW
jgi:hypothetical protein